MHCSYPVFYTLSTKYLVTL